MAGGLFPRTLSTNERESSSAFESSKSSSHTITTKHLIYIPLSPASSNFILKCIQSSSHLLPPPVDQSWRNCSNPRICCTGYTEQIKAIKFTLSESAELQYTVVWELEYKKNIGSDWKYVTGLQLGCEPLITSVSFFPFISHGTVRLLQINF